MTANPPASQIIGKYRLIAPIGRGGMANVHLACLEGPLGFHKLFVIKRLREDVELADDSLAMFLDEARLSARLSHPNIVQTVDVGEHEGSYFIAMEFLEGQSLRAVERRLASAAAPEGAVRPTQAFPLGHALRILSDVAKALHYAHELRGYDGERLNVVHRDVSPQNVFVTYDGQVKLLDFGIAKAANASHLTQVGIIKGKADYMAPEQMRGDAVDHRADIFALGVMLYEMLSQQRFSGGAKTPEAQKIHDRVTGREPKLREVRPGVPEPLARICDKAIALEPARRFASALEFAQALDAHIALLEPRPTTEAFADIMQRAFRDERSQMRKLIDQRMLLATEATSSSMRQSRMSVLPHAQGGGSTPPSRPSQVVDAPALPDLPDVPAPMPTRTRVIGIAAAVLLASSAIGGLSLAFGGGGDAPLEPPPARAQEHEAASPSPEGALRPRVETAPRVEPKAAEQAPTLTPAMLAGDKPKERPVTLRVAPARGRASSRRSEPAPEQAASPAPAPAHAPAPRGDEFEPGNDFRTLTPARGREADVELEEDPYE